jgi:coenzyme F420-dependent glucose-6-phosphate dehydrogenase
MAQSFAALQSLYPGRAYLGVGPGDPSGEGPGDEDDRIGRLEEALELIGRLLDGEHVDHRGRYFSTADAYLHTLPEQRLPIYVSAHTPETARVAGRLADGMWALADANTAELIDGYLEGCDEVGLEPGEILLQTGFSWADSDEQALAAARVWQASADPGHGDDWHDAWADDGDEDAVDDERLREAHIVSADPEEHAARIRALEDLGATTVVLMNISGGNPLAAIEAYRESVLPAVRGAVA